MARKILSSRPTEDSNLSILQELLFAVKQMLDYEDDPIPGDLDATILALDEDVIELLVEYSDLHHDYSNARGDNMVMTIRNSALEINLEQKTAVMDELLKPIDPNGEILSDALGVLIYSGSAKTETELSEDGSVTAVFSFTEEDLRQALAQAIESYVVDTQNEFTGK